MRRGAAGYGVLFISLLCTLVLYFPSRRIVEARERARFEEAETALFKAAELHLSYHIDVLKGVRGLFLTGQQITADVWKRYFESYHLHDTHPGVLDLGYAVHVPAAEKEKHLAAMSREWKTAYEIIPEGERPVYFPIIYLEEVGFGFKAPMGWDQFSEARRRAAMERARDTGEPASTGRVEVYAYNRATEPGFVVYLPVYRSGVTPATLEGRRAALEGFVFGSYAPSKLWKGLTYEWNHSIVDLEIFDGQAVTRENLLYDGNGSFHSDRRARYSGQMQAETLGRSWGFYFSTTPAFDLDSRTHWPLLVLVGGLIVSGLLHAIARKQVLARVASEKAGAELRRSGEILRQTNERLNEQMEEGERVREALRDGERRLRALVNAIDDVIFEIDENGSVLNIWASNEESLLKPKNEVIGHRVQEFVEPGLAARSDAIIRRTLATGRPENLEYALDLPAGRRWFLARVSPILSAHGDPRSVCLLARDITERKQAEEALVQSQARLRMINRILAEGAAGGGFELSLLGVLAQMGEHFSSVQAVYATVDENGQWSAHHSVEPAGWPSLRGRKIDLSVAPDFWAALRRRAPLRVSDVASDARSKPLAEVFAAHGTRALLHWPLPRSETQIGLVGLHSPTPRGWTDYEIETLKEIVECLSFSAQQHEAQEERRRAEQALAAEKERLSVTLRSIGDGVITTDTRGHITLVNKVAEMLTGWPQENAIGFALEEVFQVIHEKTRLPVENPVARILAAGEIFGLASDTVLVARDGRERMISNSGAPILDAEGSTIGVVLVFRDITDRQKLEAEMVKATKIESLGLLAGGIAHDFNNILTGILGNVSLAKMFSPEAGDIQERLSQAEKACLRAKELTQQLLDFSKGGSPVKRAASIIELIEKSSAFALHGSNVRTELELAPDLWPVEVDSAQIGQVIGHLTMNAAEALPDGGIIKVRAENLAVNWQSVLPLPEGQYVRISFADPGATIDANHLPRIFDPYFSTKQRASGLVLATAYAIVKKHGGLIRAESEAGRPTTFEVYLPAAAQFGPERLETPIAPHPQHKRILVMDDDPQILDLAQAVLSRLGYESELSADGTEAVRRYSEAQATGNPFAVAILDLTVPGAMGGREALEKLAAIDPNVRAIVSSGYANDPVLANFREFGFSAFVTKPYQADELARALEQVLRHGRG